MVLSEFINLCTSQSPDDFRGLGCFCFSTGIEFFSHNYYLFLITKIFAKWSVTSTAKHRNKTVHWHKMGYALSISSCRHCIQFPLFDFLSLIFPLFFFFFFFFNFFDYIFFFFFFLCFFFFFFFFSFSSLYFIIDFIGTAFVKNNCLFNKYAKQFLFYCKCYLSI